MSQEIIMLLSFRIALAWSYNNGIFLIIVIAFLKKVLLD